MWKKLGVQNMSDLVRREIHGNFVTKNPTKNQIRKYHLETELEFNPANLIMSKEVSITTIAMKSLPGVKMIEQYVVSSFRLDLHLPDDKLAIETDEERK